VGEVNDGREAVEKVKELMPDIVFMDITMPILNGLEATERITRDYPKVRVIILSRHETEEYFWGALKRGAARLSPQKAAIAELEAAITRVAGGEIYLSREIFKSARQEIPFATNRPGEKSLEQLTDRQREILQLIAEGQTTKAIALILKVSPKLSNTTGEIDGAFEHLRHPRAGALRFAREADHPGIARFGSLSLQVCSTLCPEHLA